MPPFPRDHTIGHDSGVSRTEVYASFESIYNALAATTQHISIPQEHITQGIP